MEKKSLMQLLRRRNYADFAKAVVYDGLKDVVPAEEVKFFTGAPKSWIAKYLDNRAPSMAGERVLVTKGSMALLEIACATWGLYSENVLEVLKNGSDKMCLLMIENLRFSPGAEAETAMLDRKDPHIFRCWLENFRFLSEDAERLLEERSDLNTLKNMYIEQQSQL